MATRRWPEVTFPIAAFLIVAAVVFVDIAWSVSALRDAGTVGPHPSTVPHPWLAGWVRWDATWYWNIADIGYFYKGTGQQSSVAFFPMYPLVLHWTGGLVHNIPLAGIVVTFLAGLGATVLFYRWTAERLDVSSARWAVVVLLLYPFSWFLFGAVYSDAMFLVLVLGAFCLVERGRPVLGGLVGALATATRPVGPAVVAGLVAIVLVRVLPRPALPLTDYLRRAGRAVRTLKPSDAGVLLSALGMVAYMLYLRHRFGDPLAFIRVQTAPGWDHKPNIDTLFKLPAFRALTNGVWEFDDLRIGAQAIVTLLALASIPSVFRRLGAAAGIYVVAVVGLPVVSSPDFMPMGRYLLAAFPCFAVGGDLLAKVKPARAILPLSVLGLLVFASYFSRWFLVT